MEARGESKRVVSETEVLEDLERRLGAIEQEQPSSSSSPSFAEFALVFDRLPEYRAKVSSIKERYHACLSRREELQERLGRLREGLGEPTAGIAIRPPQRLRFKVVYPGGVRVRSGPCFQDAPLGEIEGGRVVPVGEEVEVVERVLVNGQRDAFVQLQGGGYLPETKGEIIVLRRIPVKDEGECV